MSMTVNVPEELYQKAVEVAESQHLSVDDVFVSAFAEQIGEWNACNKEHPVVAAKSPRRSRQGARPRTGGF
jgi:hypothetical protein